MRSAVRLPFPGPDRSSLLRRHEICVRLVLVGVLSALLVSPAGSATRDYAVEVSATVQESPPRIDFSWPADPTAPHYHVFKKALADTVWGDPIALLDGGATVFTDTDVVIGEAYEYSFRKSLGSVTDTIAVVSGSPVTFTIRDSWGDGICCHHGLGSYEVSGPGEVYATGGAFGSEESTSFMPGVPGGPEVPLVVSLRLDVFAQETTWTLTDDQSGATLAEGGPYVPPRFGHILAGIRYPAREDRGTVLILVAPEIAMPTYYEVARLELDLIAEGYRSRLHYVVYGSTVTDIKQLILSAVQADPTIETLLLLGHVPVPYSGDVRGAHSNHQGAWPADLFYGELDGEWTDTTVYNTSATRPENHNVPGDGKYDQTFLPSEVDLQVGRVDLSELPAFGWTEPALMRRYLDKNHDFRRGAFIPERRGLIDDNVGEASGLAFAAVGWRNFSAMFGSSNVHALDYFSTLAGESYLWSYGCGGGSYTSCAGIGTTSDFATRTVHTIFTPLYGSYFGDWDNSNNILRAPLAAAGEPLACFWAGRPTWHLHHMALGFPIGHSTRLTQNNNHLYTVSDGGRQIHTALMGDPTLRLHTVRPVASMLVSQPVPGEVLLTWSEADEPVEGYHVYRAAGLREMFVRLNAVAVIDTSMIDPAPLSGRNVYMVRTIKLETGGSGTYENLSPGILDSTNVATGVAEATAALPLQSHLAACFPNPFNPRTSIRYYLATAGEIDLRIYTMSGRLVRILPGERQPAGWHAIDWDGRDDAGRSVVSGVYSCRLEAEGVSTSRRMTLLK